MAKELITRISLKYDTYTNWTTSLQGPNGEPAGKDLVLLKGEIGICEIPTSNNDSNVAPTVLFKVGNGTTKFELLPWASAKAADVYAWAKASDVQVSGKTLVFKNGKVKTDGSGAKEDLVLTFNFATPEEVAAAVKVEADKVAALQTAVGAAKNGSTAATGLYKAIADEATARENGDKAINDKIGGSYTSSNTVAKAIKATDDKFGSDITSTNTVSKAIKGITDQLGTGFDSTNTVAKKVEANTTNISGINTRLGYDKNGDVAATGLFKTVADEISNRASGDKAINDKIGGSYTSSNTVAKAISDVDAKFGSDITSTNTVSKAIKNINDKLADSGSTGSVIKQHSEKIDSLETKVGTAKTTNSAATGLFLALDNEADTRSQADTALGNRLTKVEAFFASADDGKGNYTGLTNALDTLVEIQDWLTNEGTTTGQFIDRIGAVENSLKDTGVVGSRIKANEEDIVGLQTAVGAAKNGNTAATGLFLALDNEIKARGDGDKAITDQIGTGFSSSNTVAKAIDDTKKLLSSGSDFTATNTVAKAINDINAKLGNGFSTASTATKQLGDLSETVTGINTRVGTAKNGSTAATGLFLALDNEANTRSNADKAINDKIGGSYDSTNTVAKAIKAVDDKLGSGISSSNTVAKVTTDITNKIGSGFDSTNTVAKAIADVKESVAGVTGDYLKKADLFIINCGTSNTVVHTL